MPDCRDAMHKDDPNALLFHRETLPVLYTVDQGDILFHKKLK